MGRPTKKVAKATNAKNSTTNNKQKAVTKNTTNNTTPTKSNVSKNNTNKPVAKKTPATNNRSNKATATMNTNTNKSPRGRKPTKDLEATLKGAQKTNYSKIEQRIIELENNRRKAINELNSFLNKNEFNGAVYDNLKRKTNNERNNARRQNLRSKNK